MHALLFIDDGTLGMLLDANDRKRVRDILRQCIIASYLGGGWLPSTSKLLFSGIMNEFLQKVYVHGIHVACCLRALCHVCTQDWPNMCVVRQEILTISAGAQGVHRIGGHAIRIQLAMAFLLHVSVEGGIGRFGHLLSGLVLHGNAAEDGAFDWIMLLVTVLLRHGWFVEMYEGVTARHQRRNLLNLLDTTVAKVMLINVSCHDCSCWPSRAPILVLCLFLL